VSDALQPLSSTNQIASVVISTSEANPTILGRSNEKLANLLDSFVSRTAATAFVQKSGPSETQVVMAVVCK
jgi:hypothetical protein